MTSQAPIVPGNVIREEKVEYRDQDGNILNEEQVKALEGKVSFSTKYETRTRILDAQGNEIANSVLGSSEDSSIAPPHPEAERIPETKGIPEDEGRDSPASVSPEEDLMKEKSVEESDSGAAKPASEAQEATQK